MNKSFFKNMLYACVALVASVALLASCGDSKEDPAPVKADLTVLQAVVDSSQTLVAAATTADFEQGSIDAFKKAIDLANQAIALPGITQSQVDAAVVNLRVAKKAFLASEFGSIPDSALLLGLDFEEGSGDQLTAQGKDKLVATLRTGPSELFGTDIQKPTFVAGKVGAKAMHFAKGANLTIDTYSVADFTGKTMSISVWLKPDSTRQNGHFLSLDTWHTWKFQLQENNKPFFTVHTDIDPDETHANMDNEAVESVPNNSWTHVVLVMDLSNKTTVFYVNGAESKKWDNTQRPALGGNVVKPITPTPIFIGAELSYAVVDWETSAKNWGYFAGTMDELQVYNIALDAGQVAKLYNDTK